MVADYDDAFEDITETGDGYFKLRDVSTLCFSSNLLIDTEVFDIDPGNGVSMDYDYCMVSLNW